MVMLMLLMIIILILIIAFFPTLTDTLLRLSIKPFSEKFYQKIHGITDTFEHGFEIIKNPSQYIR